MTLENSFSDQNKLIEELAAIEHERWAHWQRYLHSKCLKNQDGSLVIPAELVARWDKQMNTDYAHLTQNEKQSDREQVEKYLPLLLTAVLNNKS